MKAFTKITAIVAPLDRSNVDTDAIIPKQFLKSIKRSGFGPNAFDEWRYLDHGEPGMDNSKRPLNPDFSLNQPRYQGTQILLTRKNFGCGSSREHAPIAIAASGVPVVIAASFARIFYRNGINIGLPLLEIGDDVEKISAGDRLRVDTATGAIENLTTGDTFRAHPLPGFVQEIAQAGGLLNYIRENGGFRHGV